MKKKIEEYQYEELNNEILFINKYSFDLMYLYELNRYWKEFAFDLLAEFSSKQNISIGQMDDLLIHIKKNYKIIIEENNLDIDFKDYVELNDYVTLKEWLELTNNFIEVNEDGIYLIKE